MNVQHRTFNIEHRIMYSVILAILIDTQCKYLCCASEFVSVFCRLTFYKIDKAQRYPHWTLEVGRSMFDVQQYHAFTGSAFRLLRAPKASSDQNPVASNQHRVSSIQQPAPSIQQPEASLAFYHLISALPQVSPPPNTGMQIICPGWILLSRTASSSAIAQDADEILP